MKERNLKIWKTNLKTGNETEKPKKLETKELNITLKLEIKERKPTQKHEMKQRNPFKNWN